MKDVAITTPALSTLNKNQKSLYQTLLIEDFGYSALDMMPNITYGVECSIFKGENWKFFYKPRFENYRTIATSLGLDAELKYIQTYQKTLAGYSKYACGTELEF